MPPDATPGAAPGRKDTAIAAPQPLLLLLSAPPDAPGAAEVLTRAATAAARDARPVRVLLSGPGLPWARDPALAELATSHGVDVGVCSAAAREAGWTLADTPHFVRWTARVAFFRDIEPKQPLWAVL